MNIKINNLNYVSEQLKDMSDDEIAKITGGASLSYTDAAVFSSGGTGTGRTREVFQTDTSSGDITTIFNADGTIEKSGGAQSPAVSGFSRSRG